MKFDKNSLKVMHIITDLETGGAEMMLFKLLKETKERNVDSVVVSLMSDGAVSNLIQSINIPVYSIGITQGKTPNYKQLMKFMHVIRVVKPNIIQGWMYHGNIAATVAKIILFFLLNKIKLFWNIRQTLYLLENEKHLTQIVIKLSALISWIPKKIIYNSYLSMSQHEAMGFSANKSIMLPNGFDLHNFTPQKKTLANIRSSLGITDDELLVGHIARFHPMKDHFNLLKAAELVLKSYNRVHFVLIGQDVDDDNTYLAEVIGNITGNKYIHLLGRRSNISEIISGLDVLVSSSAWGEGFPNVIGEALACGVPCVVTDVGDSALIVGDCGYVCRAEDSQVLADGILRMISNKNERERMSMQARNRIKNNYSIEEVARQYYNLYSA